MSLQSPKIPTRSKKEKAIDNDLNVINSSVVEMQETVNYIVDQYQTAIIDISSASILTMGTTPVELLPAPGQNMYYAVDWNNSFLEYKHISIPYQLNGVHSIRFNFSDTASNLIASDILTLSENVVVPLQPNFIYSLEEPFIQGYINLNSPLTLRTYDIFYVPQNVESGNSTMRVILKYMIRVFND